MIIMRSNINVILITIDCLRADFVGCINHNMTITPNIDKIAEEGIVFSSAFSNGPYTRASLPSILSSAYTNAYPDPHRFSLYRTSIAEILNKFGFYTAGFNTNAYLSSFYSYNKGFDYFDDILSGKKKSLSQSYQKIKKKVVKVIKNSRFKKILNYIPLDYSKNRDVKMLNKKVIKLLKEKRENVFIWMHYMDAHIPYTPPKRYRKISKRGVTKIFEMITNKPFQITDKMTDEVRMLYEGTIKYTDDEFGKFVEKLKEIKQYNNTLFIITSDHGDAFREHGSFSHNAVLYDELIHIPLIIKGPKIPKGLSIEHIVSSIDISPTILEYVGHEKEEDFMGMSLMPLIQNEKENYNREGVISEIIPDQEHKLVSYRTNNYKLIIDYNTGNKELYDLQEDPEERLNIYSKENEIASQFEKKIEEHEERKKINLKKVEEMKKISQIIGNLKII